MAMPSSTDTSILQLLDRVGGNVRGGDGDREWPVQVHVRLAREQKRHEPASFLVRFIAHVLVRQVRAKGGHQRRLQLVVHGVWVGVVLQQQFRHAVEPPPASDEKRGLAVLIQRVDHQPVAELFDVFRIAQHGQRGKPFFEVGHAQKGLESLGCLLELLAGRGRLLFGGRLSGRWRCGCITCSAHGADGRRTSCSQLQHSQSCERRGDRI
mmetsp:Transcript_19252/g.48171  ORF Transcript_19252/g.48171 Transcript_19252/m.48171 type:complete len:210 (-) Transcript_19252:575-1204(-)